MEFELTTPAKADDETLVDPTGGDSSFQISARPVVPKAEAESEFPPLQLPRSYGTETLSLLARDPHTVFAFWDIDWNAAFSALPTKARKVYVRLLNGAGIEQDLVEVEPMAGSSYITVADADTTYTGEIGYYHPATEWHPLATSALITTPPETHAADAEVDFATVPFHLSFQRMIDLLQVTKRENETLTSMLANLRERVTSPEARENLPPQQAELARVVETLRPPGDTTAASRPPEPRLQQKLERILGFGGSSPTGGFGGSSRSA